MGGFSSRTVLFNDKHVEAYLHGELDACTATCLTARLLPIATTGRDITIDFTGLDFVDTAGLLALVDVQREAARAGGSLTLTKLPRAFRRLLELTDLKDKFAITDRVPPGF